MTSASAAIPQPGRTKAFLRLVMIEHSVFALPFAYIAALTAMFQWDKNIHWGKLLLVTVCMVGLRTFAMAVNRIIDREIDARNPRTAQRELVTGAMSVKHAWTGALIALAVFLTAAALLNPLCLALAPIAVIPMVVYPYGKRFTNFPQAILGLAQAMGPVGGWLAISGEWSWDAVILGLAVGIWIGGFDLIYACQDVETDREIGVMSVPARFGIPSAIWGARVCHALTTALFVWYALATGAGAFFWLGLLIVAAAFLYEHSIVRPHDLSRVNRAFFSVNGFIGIALFVCALLDLLVRGLTVLSRGGARAARLRAAADEDGRPHACEQAYQVALPADARLGGGQAREDGAAPDRGDQDPGQDAQGAPLDEAGDHEEPEQAEDHAGGARGVGVRRGYEPHAQAVHDDDQRADQQEPAQAREGGEEAEDQQRHGVRRQMGETEVDEGRGDDIDQLGGVARGDTEAVQRMARGHVHHFQQPQQRHPGQHQLARGQRAVAL